jgi:radical SAM superfamily enzyme YgiQ (UPF0313 family)
VTSVLLIYPYFKPRRDRSAFRFPPLGISYVASSLREAGHEVQVLDCTFLDRHTAMDRAMLAGAEVVGIYCMVTMLEDCLRFAGSLRAHCQLLVAGGPLPTCDPALFAGQFDVVITGEGEATMVELLRAFEQGQDWATIPGLAWRERGREAGSEEEQIQFSSERPFEKELDRLPFPARDLLPNDEYIHYGRKKYGYAITTVMSTRGCPFRCEFCSNVVFGASFRERSAQSVVDEIEAVLRLGYERISFADDVFTFKRQRVIEICREINCRGLRFKWECLGRVDSLDDATAREMKQAGCTRIYFGIESGDDRILKLMNKNITAEEARRAVEAAHRAGIQVGAFFILFYPGDTEETVLATLRYATRLPVDYLGLSMPYPLPGTALYARVRERINRDWRPEESVFGSHVLIFEAGFSEAKMWFGIFKGRLQFEIRRRLGKLGPLVLRPFEHFTDTVFRLLK